MKHNKIFLILFSMLTLAYNSYAQEKITLSEAITIALNHNTSLVKSTNSLEVTTQSVKSAYGSLLPNLNLSSSWGWSRTVNAGTDQVGYLGEITHIPESTTDTRSYSLSLGGNLTLFDGLSSWTNISAKENDLKNAKYDLEKTRSDVILQTVNLFVSVLNAEKVLNFQKEDQKYNKDLYNKVKEMYDLKMNTNADLYSQEYQMSNSQLSYLNAVSTYEKAKVSLLNYLSKDVLQNYTFQMDDTFSSIFIKSTTNLDSLVQVAFENRKDYQSQKGKLIGADYQLTIAQSGYYPSLSGNYSMSTNAIEPSALFKRKSYSLGLSFSLPIFSKFSTETSVQSAKIQKKNAQEDTDALERQIKSDIKNAATDLQTINLQLAVTKAALKASTETWSIKKDSYLLGTATFIDQQQSYRDYIQANNNAIQAETNYIYRQFSLLSALGLLKTE